MNNEHLDEQLIQSCFSGELSEDQESATRRHLDQCDVCRVRFDEFAGSSDEWQQISSVLRVEQQAIHSSTSRFGQPNSSPHFPGEYAQAPIDFAVSFLEPSDRDNVLGRLGEFEIHAVIGYGGMGIVLKGFQAELNRPVAVKVMAPHLATSAAARKRFLREAQATAAIVHPNVMPILSVSEKGTLPFLVMPYVACHSLQQRMDAEGTLPIVEVLRISLQVAEGLAAAHGQGLVHRDVKPANILLERGVDRALLTDFGLARAVDDATLTRSGVIAGTPQYMSPEQARGDAVDARSDLFSLGSVIYAMCVGHPPFRCETSYGILRKVTDSEPRAMRESNVEVPPWLERLVQRLMAKDRDQRYPDATHVAQLIRQCLAQVQQPMSQTIPSELQESKPKRKRLFEFVRTKRLLSFLMLALCLVLAVSFWLQLQAKEVLTKKFKIEKYNQGSSNYSHSVPEPLMTHEQIHTEIEALASQVDRLAHSLEDATTSDTPMVEQ